MSHLGGFETEADVEERRKKRQEEWDKVRKADEPEEAPEEPYDGRSLYERLKEQKDAKDLEFEESRKFKNMIRGLDDDDVDHLHEVDTRKIEDERKNREEEKRLLNEFKTKRAELQEENAEQKHNHLAAATLAKSKPKDPVTRQASSQKAILSAVVKRKQPPAADPPTKVLRVEQPSAHKCLAVLPGIGDYTSSTDSDSSDVEAEVNGNGRMDLTGRRIVKKKDEGCE